MNSAQAQNSGKEMKEGTGPRADRPGGLERHMSTDRNMLHDTPRTDELKDTLGDAGASLRHAAAAAMPAAKEQLGRVGDAVAEQTQSLEQTLVNRIREKPINSVLIAAGLGVFAGLFLIRR